MTSGQPLDGERRTQLLAHPDVLRTLGLPDSLAILCEVCGIGPQPPLIDIHVELEFAQDTRTWNFRRLLCCEHQEVVDDGHCHHRKVQLGDWTVDEGLRELAELCQQRKLWIDDNCQNCVGHVSLTFPLVQHAEEFLSAITQRREGCSFYDRLMSASWHGDGDIEGWLLDCRPWQIVEEGSGSEVVVEAELSFPVSDYPDVLRAMRESACD